jgi:hypothetical protein
MDYPATVLNEDEDLESLMHSMTHERRSGLDRRQAPDSATQFRLEIGREYRAEIRQLRDEELRKDHEITALQVEITRLKDWQMSHEETLVAAAMVVHAGTVMKYVIASVIGLTGLIGGIALSLDAIRAWGK